MQAYVISPGSTEAPVRVERPDPVAGPGQVLIGVRAVSLNYRDLLVVGGTYGSMARDGLVVGSDAAGEVLAVGEGVSCWTVGDRVIGGFFPDWVDGDQPASRDGALGAGETDGVLAQRIVLPAHALVRIPEWMSFEEAATLPCAAVTAWNALFERKPIGPSSTVLLQGTGGVSIFALQLARLAGARVIITSSSDEKLERARALGADAVVNYRTTPEWQDEVLRLTGGIGADVALDVGGPDTLQRSLAALRAGGRVAIIGVLSGHTADLDILTMIVKRAHVEGIMVAPVAMLRRMVDAIDRARLHPVIDRSFAFDKAADAYAHLRSGTHFGKVVVRVD